MSENDGQKRILVIAGLAIAALVVFVLLLAGPVAGLGAWLLFSSSPPASRPAPVAAAGPPVAVEAAPGPRDEEREQPVGGAEASIPVPPSPGVAAPGGSESPGRIIASPDAVLAAANEERPTQALTPRWLVGDSWVVHVWFRQAQQPRGLWTVTPDRLRYRVTDATTFEGVGCFEVTVDMLTGEEGAPDPDFSPEMFYVDRSRYVLVGLSRQSREGGKWVPRTYRFHAEGEGPAEGEGSTASNTHVPFDLPPVGVLGQVAPGDDPFAEFRFTEPGAPRPRPHEMLNAGGDYLEVEFSTSEGVVRQRWSTTDPRWPVESVTAEARSYRLAPR